MNPFEAANSDDAVPLDVHVRVAIGMLVGWGVVCFVLAVIVAAVGILPAVLDLPRHPDDPPPAVIATIVGLEGAAVAAVGLVYFVAAVGLGARRTWGWVLAMLAFSFQFAGCCAPIGLYGFFALLREDARRAYGLL